MKSSAKVRMRRIGLTVAILEFTIFLLVHSCFNTTNYRLKHVPVLIIKSVKGLF